MANFKSLEENKEIIIENLIAIDKSFENIEELDIHSFDKDKTVIAYVDVIHGFLDTGALSSSRAKNILNPLKKLRLKTEGYKKIFLKDTHTPKSVELKTYPEHCIENTIESRLYEGLDTDSEASTIIEKNSINGFLSPEFTIWRNNNENITNYIIVGLVTDICVMNFALTIKAYFNQENIDSNIVIIKDCVESFDLEVTNHNAQVMDLFALYNMRMNGIEIVSLK